MLSCVARVLPLLYACACTYVRARVRACVRACVQGAAQGNVFSYNSMCPLTTECVLVLYVCMCTGDAQERGQGVTVECVHLLQNVFSYYTRVCV